MDQTKRQKAFSGSRRQSGGRVSGLPSVDSVLGDYERSKLPRNMSLEKNRGPAQESGESGEEREQGGVTGGAELNFSRDHEWTQEEKDKLEKSNLSRRREESLAKLRRDREELLDISGKFEPGNPNFEKIEEILGNIDADIDELENGQNPEEDEVGPEPEERDFGSEEEDEPI